MRQVNYRLLANKKNQATPHRGIAWQELAGLTGLEPATSGVTGRRCNRLYYSPLDTVGLDLVGETGLEPATLGL